jgi:hypothetical protein
VTEPYKKLRIGHLSLRVFDTDKEAISDLRKALTLKPHILCGTESGNRTRETKLRSLLTTEGYMSYFAPEPDGWIAVKKRLVNGGWSAGYRKVLGSGRATNDPHPHTEYGPLWVTFENPQMGRVSVVGGGHYLTKGRWPDQAQQDHPGDPVDHVAANRKLAHAIAEKAMALAEGREAVAFVTADTNLLDKTTDVFYGKALTTCWDELDKHPDTGHGNIDVVASVDADRRVRCMKADALNDKNFFLHTDHFLVMTEYRIRKINSMEGPPR